MQRVLSIWVTLFPLWVVVICGVAYVVPEPFAAMRPGIVPGLGVIMLGMGMTLVPADFARVAKMPRAVGCGMLGQFLIMPAVAWLLARGFGLPPDYALGLIVLGACPGGTASNVIAFLAKADVALSVTMTASSTMLAVVLTPWITWLLGGTYLEVDAFGMFVSMLKIVLLPVTVGVALHTWKREAVDKVMAVFPALSVLVIVLIIGAIAGLSHEKLPELVGALGVAVVCHNLLGLGAGYGLATLFRLPEAARRTVAIEVGMQNSGLAVSLATAHFNAAAALPGSLFSVVHNLSGSGLAAWWRRGGKTEA